MDVSVIIPTHRRPDLLRQAVESVQRQTRPPIEIIIVEDDKIPGYSNLKSEPWADQVVLLSLPGLGGGSARNFGAQHARGNYIAFLDDDDLWEPQKLEIQLSVFEKNPSVDLVFSDGFIFTEEDRPSGLFQDNKGLISQSSWFKDNSEVTIISEGLKIKEIFSGIVITSSIMIKKTFFEAIGRFDENLKGGQDVDLALRANQSGKIAYVDKPLFRYRLTPNSISRNLDKSFFNTYALLNKWLEGDFDKKDRRYLNAERLFAMQSLAYSLFSQGRLSESKSWYGKCLHEKPSLKNIMYFLASFCGQGNVERIRKIKMRLKGSS
jgi:glycosyltransferase involved in cell wall biosynthesis